MRELTTIESDNGKGLAKIFFSSKNEGFVVEYYDDVGHLYFTEEFSNRTLAQVENKVEDWALGYRALEENA